MSALDEWKEKVGQQLTLPLGAGWAQEALEIMGSHEQAHNPTFTGERVFKSDPEKYGRIVALRVKMGATIRDIAAIEKVSPQTVMAIMRREEASKTAEQYREETSAELAAAVRTTLDRINEDLGDEKKMKKTGLRDKAYLLKELAEKRELLSGGATSRQDGTQKEEMKRAEAERHARSARELLEGELVEEVTGGRETGDGIPGTGDGGES